MAQHTRICANIKIVFETELMGIQGVESPASIIEKTAESGASSVASSIASEATEGIKEKIAEKLGEAAEAVKITLQDTDGDGQEHNEL
jgi:FK506-binding protein 2